MTQPPKQLSSNSGILRIFRQSVLQIGTSGQRTHTLHDTKPAAPGDTPCVDVNNNNDVELTENEGKTHFDIHVDEHSKDDLKHRVADKLSDSLTESGTITEKVPLSNSAKKKVKKKAMNAQSVSEQCVEHSKKRSGRPQSNTSKHVHSVKNSSSHGTSIQRSHGRCQVLNRGSHETSSKSASDCHSNQQSQRNSKVHIEENWDDDIADGKVLCGSVFEETKQEYCRDSKNDGSHMKHVNENINNLHLNEKANIAKQRTEIDEKVVSDFDRLKVEGPDIGKTNGDDSVGPLASTPKKACRGAGSRSDTNVLDVDVNKQFRQLTLKTEDTTDQNQNVEVTVRNEARNDKVKIFADRKTTASSAKARKDYMISKDNACNSNSKTQAHIKEHARKHGSFDQPPRFRRDNYSVRSAQSCSTRENGHRNENQDGAHGRHPKTGFQNTDHSSWNRLRNEWGSKKNNRRNNCWGANTATSTQHTDGNDYGLGSNVVKPEPVRDFAGSAAPVVSVLPQNVVTGKLTEDFPVDLCGPEDWSLEVQSDNADRDNVESESQHVEVLECQSVKKHDLPVEENVSRISQLPGSTTTPVYTDLPYLPPPPPIDVITEESYHLQDVQEAEPENISKYLPPIPDEVEVASDMLQCGERERSAERQLGNIDKSVAHVPDEGSHVLTDIVMEAKTQSDVMNYLPPPPDELDCWETEDLAENAATSQDSCNDSRHDSLQHVFVCSQERSIEDTDEGNVDNVVVPVVAPKTERMESDIVKKQVKGKGSVPKATSYLQKKAILTCFDDTTESRSEPSLADVSDFQFDSSVICDTEASDTASTDFFLPPNNKYQSKKCPPKAAGNRSHKVKEKVETVNLSQEETNTVSEAEQYQRFCYEQEMYYRMQQQTRTWYEQNAMLMSDQERQYWDFYNYQSSWGWYPPGYFQNMYWYQAPGYYPPYNNMAPRSGSYDQSYSGVGQHPARDDLDNDGNNRTSSTREPVTADEYRVSAGGLTELCCEDERMVEEIQAPSICSVVQSNSGEYRMSEYWSDQMPKWVSRQDVVQSDAESEYMKQAFGDSGDDSRLASISADNLSNRGSVGSRRDHERSIANLSDGESLNICRTEQIIGVQGKISTCSLTDSESNVRTNVAASNSVEKSAASGDESCCDLKMDDAISPEYMNIRQTDQTTTGYGEPINPAADMDVSAQDEQSSTAGGDRNRVELKVNHNIDISSGETAKLVHKAVSETSRYGHGSASLEANNTDQIPATASCHCCPDQVMFLVWRMCKCDENATRLHRIIPGNIDDPSVDLGYHSHDSADVTSDGSHLAGVSRTGSVVSHTRKLFPYCSTPALTDSCYGMRPAQGFDLFVYPATAAAAVNTAASQDAQAREKVMTPNHLATDFDQTSNVQQTVIKEDNAVANLPSGTDECNNNNIYWKAFVSSAEHLPKLSDPQIVKANLNRDIAEGNVKQARASKTSVAGWTSGISGEVYTWQSDLNNNPQPQDNYSQSIDGQPVIDVRCGGVSVDTDGAKHYQHLLSTHRETMYQSQQHVPSLHQSSHHLDKACAEISKAERTEVNLVSALQGMTKAVYAMDRLLPTDVDSNEDKENKDHANNVKENVAEGGCGKSSDACLRSLSGSSTSNSEEEGEIRDEYSDMMQHNQLIASHSAQHNETRKNIAATYQNPRMNLAPRLARPSLLRYPEYPPSGSPSYPPPPHPPRNCRFPPFRPPPSLSGISQRMPNFPTCSYPPPWEHRYQSPLPRPSMAYMQNLTNRKTFESPPMLSNMSSQPFNVTAKVSGCQESMSDMSNEPVTESMKHSESPGKHVKRKYGKDSKPLNQHSTKTNPRISDLKLVDYGSSEDEVVGDSNEQGRHQLDGDASRYEETSSSGQVKTPKRFKPTDRNSEKTDTDLDEEYHKASYQVFQKRGKSLRQKSLRQMSPCENNVLQAKLETTPKKEAKSTKRSFSEVIGGAGSCNETNNTLDQHRAEVAVTSQDRHLPTSHAVNMDAAAAVAAARMQASLSPLPPFPASPFWSMYLGNTGSALLGHSPTERVQNQSPLEPARGRSSVSPSLLWQQKLSPGLFRSPSTQYFSPGQAAPYSPSETDSESFSSRSEWRRNFIRFHTYGVKYIDTHCHLDFLFSRAGFSGNLKKYMNTHPETFPETFEGCVAVFCNPSSFTTRGGLWMEVIKEENVWIAMGCHPKMATDFTDVSEYGLRQCLKHDKFVALGEIGLDYSGTFRQHEEVQKRVFRCQLKIAMEMKKPLVIHCRDSNYSRDAENDCLQILKELVPRDHKIHCHCFTSHYDHAKLWLEAFPNLYIGMTPLVTYRSASDSHHLAKRIPLDRLLLETDAPYFIPRCIPKEEMHLSNPGVAITVAKEVAFYQELPVAAVLRQCRLNTKAMYGI